MEETEVTRVALCCHHVVALQGLYALRSKSEGFKDGKMLTAKTHTELNLSDTGDGNRT